MAQDDIWDPGGSRSPSGLLRSFRRIGAPCGKRRGYNRRRLEVGLDGGKGHGPRGGAPHGVSRGATRLVSPPASLAGRLRRRDGPPLVIAHRGGRTLAAENTLAAAERALAVGADLWEFDVQLTRDAVPILLHDETLERTTDAAARFPDRAPWRADAFKVDEVRTLDAGSWFSLPDGSRPFTGERVPTLEEALRWTVERGIDVNVELKGTSRTIFLSRRGRRLAERTVALLRRFDILPRAIVSSFDPALLRHVKRITPEVPCALLLLSLPADPVAALVEARAAVPVNAVAIPPEAFHAEVADALGRAGVRTLVWTVNTEEGMVRLAREPFVAGIVTDDPALLGEVLARLA